MIKILALPETQNSAITVHLGPGTFETKGYRTDSETSLSGWQPKAGMKIIGSGTGVTTIQLTNATVTGAHYCAFGHALTARWASRLWRKIETRITRIITNDWVRFVVIGEIRVFVFGPIATDWIRDDVEVVLTGW